MRFLYGLNHKLWAFHTIDRDQAKSSRKSQHFPPWSLQRSPEQMGRDERR